MKDLIIEQLLKERKLFLSVINNFNLDAAKNKGFNLSEVIEYNNSLLNKYSKFNQSQRNDKVLDKMFQDMGYNKKTHNVKYLKKNENLTDLNVDIFLN